MGICHSNNVVVSTTETIITNPVTEFQSHIIQVICPLPQGKICAICSEEITYGSYYDRCNFCNQVFDYNSLVSWLNVRRKCPICAFYWYKNTVRHLVPYKRIYLQELEIVIHDRIDKKLKAITELRNDC